MDKRKRAGEIDMEEKRYNVDERDADEQRQEIENDQLMFYFNHALPHTKHYEELMFRLFPNMEKDSYVSSPVSGVKPDRVKIGKRVHIMPNCLLMASGGITIDDDAMIAANVQIISNNHDLENRRVITCLPVHICRNVWIGAGSTILRGVTIGENSVVGAGSVVTKDVEPNTIVAGNPARVLKRIETKI